MEAEEDDGERHEEEEEDAIADGDEVQAQGIARARLFRNGGRAVVFRLSGGFKRRAASEWPDLLWEIWVGMEMGREKETRIAGSGCGFGRADGWGRLEQARSLAEGKRLFCRLSGQAVRCRRRCRVCAVGGSARLVYCRGSRWWSRSTEYKQPLAHSLNLSAAAAAAASTGNRQDRPRVTSTLHHRPTSEPSLMPFSGHSSSLSRPFPAWSVLSLRVRSIYLLHHWWGTRGPLFAFAPFVCP